jgi:excinuclease ABC subunit C
VIEALILEADLIKRYQPHYNILLKDDRSFLYVLITREKFPRVLILRESEILSHARPLGCFGPFTSGSSLRLALKILRRILPWSNHDAPSLRGVLRSRATKQSHHIKERLPRGLLAARNDRTRPCFDYQIGLCPGVCAGLITVKDYRKNINDLLIFFRGGRKKLISKFKKEMQALAKENNFEAAAKIRNKIYVLEHIQDVALIKKEENISTDFNRVEGYDISNISGTFASGSMVVFTNNVPDKAQYRKFRIKTITGPNDVAMLAEVLRRRFNNNWLKPDLILIDGGAPQVNVARQVISELNFPPKADHPLGEKIPVIGIAKGPERKRNDFLYPRELHAKILRNREMLIRVRDEAHRFAVKYHRVLRGRIR